MLDLHKIQIAGIHLLNIFLAISLCLTAEMPHFIFSSRLPFSQHLPAFGSKKGSKKPAVLMGCWQLLAVNHLGKKNALKPQRDKYLIRLRVITVDKAALMKHSIIQLEYWILY